MEDKKCGNCRYYIAHYTKTASGFNYMYQGHCINAKRKLYCDDLSKPCEFWENGEIQVLEREKHISKVLRIMARRIDKIAEVIKDDYKM